MGRDKIEERSIFGVILIIFIFCHQTMANQNKSHSILNSKQDTVQSNKFTRDGLRKYVNKDYEGALDDLEKAISYNHDNWKAYRYKGDVLQELNKYQNAIPAYTEAITINKKDILSYAGRAESKRQLLQVKEALEDFDTVVNSGIVDLSVFFGRGCCLLELGKVDQAIGDFTRCIELSPRTANPYLKRGSAYLNKGLYAKSIEDFDHYLGLGKTKGGVFFLRGKAHFYLSEADSSHIKKSIMDFRKHLTYYKEDPDSYWFIGILYYYRKDTLKSRENFEKAFSLNPNDYKMVAYWGFCELVYHNYPKAIELLEESIIKSKSPASYQYFHLGLARIMTKDTLKALDNFKKALTVDSTYKEVYAWRMTLLISDPKYAATVLSDLNYLIRVTEGNKEKAEGYSWRCMVELGTGDVTNAKVDVDKAIALMPEEPYHYLMRAFVNFNSGGGKDKILEDLDRAIQIDGTMTEAYLFKARYYASLRDYTHGCKALEIAVQTGASVSKEIKDYICKGKLPKNGKIPDLYFPVGPRLNKMDSEFNFEN
jgi:tetratricopeptide (TPR) repeat protein